MGCLHITYHLRIITLTLFLLILFNIYEGFSQSNSQKESADHFNHLTYEKIQNLEMKALDAENWEKLRKLIQVHLSKAKAENNELEIARAFYYKTNMVEPALGLVYADSIIEITQNSSHSSYPTLGYALKGHIYYNSGDFQSALDSYLKAYNLALTKNNIQQQRDISLAIAAIRNINGQHYAAAELYKRTLNLLKKEGDPVKNHYQDYINLLYNLSLTHLRLQELDSSKFYAKKGIEQTSSLGDKQNFQDFVLLDAQINYYYSNYGKAKDTLLRYVDSLEGTSKAIKLYYLGKIEEKLGNNELAVNYFENIDSIVTETGDPFNEVKDVYQQLISYAILLDDKRKQIEYMGKLIRYDSVLSAGQENILNKAMISYDIPYLKYQKKQAEEQLRAKSRYIILVGIVAGIGILFGLYFFIRTRKMRNRLKLLLEDGPTRSKFTSEKIEHPPSVPEDIRNDILKKLDTFENSDRYLRKDLDMSRLAQELETNTSYLSVIINHYRRMSFPNYLKDLRITTAIKQLSQDPELLKYNYQGLSDIFGFKTGESFSRAFYQKTGVYPSKFLNELKSRKTARHL